MVLTKRIYELTSVGSFAKDYGLCEQIRRAIISVSSNIVEGFEKNNNNEFVRYLKISKGSLGEVRSQLYAAQSIGYLTTLDYQNIDMRLQTLAKQIGVLIRYLQNVKNASSQKTSKPSKLETI